MEIGREDRAYWLSTLRRIAEPVLVVTAARRLHTSMPLEGSGKGWEVGTNEIHRPESIKQPV
ncbi:hypothetical protein KDA_52910 [Dictyobacter alpinus]|uniref:Uncharacterized protein n=1 Tax=Dictyobacter alpinus TaxID=2014873 RepID=A0A402BEW8_9CHLR|nr:hypothetical protein [Dictyobacter alpinus]GCE29807.1 hypothetical protein KDA_52910 [Dictyobacter alpinus]